MRKAVALDTDGVRAFDFQIAERGVAEGPELDAALDKVYQRPGLYVDVAIFDKDILHRQISVVAILQISDRIYRHDAVEAAYFQTAENAVSYRAVGRTAQPDRLAIARKRAIFDYHILAKRAIAVGADDGAHDDAIVARAQIAVADADFSAAVDMEAVVVDHLLVGVDLDALEFEIFAHAHPAGPSGAVLEGDAGKTDITATDELDHAGARSLGLGIHARRGVRVVEPWSLSVDDASARYADIGLEKA